MIAYVEALSDDRDAAWERAARLTVLAREMEEELERLRERAAGLPEQTYESLGDGPRRLFKLALEEAVAVRESARQHARDLEDLARDDAAEVEGPRGRTRPRCAASPTSTPGSGWPRRGRGPTRSVSRRGST